MSDKFIPLIPTDRSRSVTDWTCARKRYLNYDLDGRGIVPDNEPKELAMGTAVHSALAAIATSTQLTGTVDIDAIADRARVEALAFFMKGSPDDKQRTYALEQSSLIEGLVRGFYKYQWPKLMTAYPKILAVEQEMPYEYGQILWMSKPDLVAATPEGEVAYIEYKTTSTKKEEWITSWDTAVQLHATTRAIESALNERISHVIVQGLYKGYESYGKQSSPFCYCYKRYGTPPFSNDEISYEYKAGFKKYPAWEMEGGVKAWVENMPDEVLATQFPQTPPIFINDSMVESFFKQRNLREQEIRMAKRMLDPDDPEVSAEILNVSFPQKFDQCSPAYGRQCAYKRICFGSVTNLLTSGFKYRESHHAIEADMWKADATGTP